MKNLRDETLEFLFEHGKTWNDVIGVCGKDFKIEKDLFLKLSNKIYDDGFGSPEVAQDLKIVGGDFWIERHEYDGAEWWEYKTMPDLTKMEIKDVARVMREREYWQTESLALLQTAEFEW